MEYITKSESNPSLVTLYVKIMSSYMDLEVTNKQCEAIYNYFLERKEQLSTFDLASLIKSMSQIKNFTQEQKKTLV